MELKLEDYARRRDRMYYEIMREYADGDQTSKDFEIFIRPSSGYLGVWYFKLQDDGSKLGVDLKHSLRGEDCIVSKVSCAIWQKTLTHHGYFQKHLLM